MSHDHSCLDAWVISSGRAWTGWARWSRHTADGLSPGQETVPSTGRAQVATFVPRPAQAYVVPTTAANAGRAFVAFARCPEDRAAHTVFFERRGSPRLHKALLRACQIPRELVDFELLGSGRVRLASTPGLRCLGVACCLLLAPLPQVRGIKTLTPQQRADLAGGQAGCVFR